MLRPMIEFDYEKCTGCGACTRFCGKQVIEMRDDKPVIPEDKLCDGLGVCVPLCKFGAINVVMKDTEPFDPRAVMGYRAKKRGGFQF